MARLPRYVIPGLPQHVIQRGNNRTPIFATQSNYYVFHAYLRDACHRYRCRVHAYVFMSNHVHLLITPLSAHGISKVMQSVGRRYVRHFNSILGRTGTLWEGRYKATLIDSDRYLLTCCRYIELNPVRAGLASHPHEYAWSSYGANALAKPDPLVTPHEVYTSLGSEPENRCVAYRALFGSTLEQRTLGHIRDSTNKGWALGNDRYREVVTRMLNRRAHPLPQGGARSIDQRLEPWI